MEEQELIKSLITAKDELIAALRRHIAALELENERLRFHHHELTQMLPPAITPNIIPPDFNPPYHVTCQSNEVKNV